MAEAISTASGIVTLVAVTLKSSKFLYKTVSDFKNSPRDVRSLKEQLEALEVVLCSLKKTASKTDANFESLELPLKRCNEACQGFNSVIKSCMKHSSGNRRSFRDWGKLKYMGEDISGFTRMLEAYKSTISIALVHANIHATAVTASLVQEYRTLIENTTIDLQDHLQQIHQKLQDLSQQPDRNPNEEEDVERSRIQDEKRSAQQCLKICAQVSVYIDQIRLKDFRDISVAADEVQQSTQSWDRWPSAHAVTANALGRCKVPLDEAAEELRKRLEEVEKRLRAAEPEPLQSGDGNRSEKDTWRAEIACAKQSLAICESASETADPGRINVFEDVTVGTDGQQVIVSTIGDLISAKRIASGDRSMQIMGQMSDQTLQQFSQHRQPHHMRSNDVERNEETRSDSPQFNHFGIGRKLSGENTS